MSAQTICLAAGQVWRARRPRTYPITGEYNDRQILWTNGVRVQYDSPTVRRGRRYPTVTVEQFLKWAGTNVTAGYPTDRWATMEDV